MHPGKCFLRYSPKEWLYAEALFYITLENLVAVYSASSQKIARKNGP